MIEFWASDSPGKGSQRDEIFGRQRVTMQYNHPKFSMMTRRDQGKVLRGSNPPLPSRWWDSCGQKYSIRV